MNRSALATFSLVTAIAVMTLGYANPSYAAQPVCHNPPEEFPHPSCKPAGDSGGASFVVTIEGSGLTGGSAEDVPWVQGVLGKNGIGLNDVAPDFLYVGTLKGLSMFTGESYLCFPGDYGNPSPPPHTTERLFDLHQAIIKSGKKGRAEAHLWFHGETRLPVDETGGNERVRVLYVLKLFGIDGSAAGFPPLPDDDPLNLDMTSWELKVENDGKTIKAISCQAEGGDNVTIEVTAL